jgi:hypothetical protein
MDEHKNATCHMQSLDKDFHHNTPHSYDHGFTLNHLLTNLKKKTNGGYFPWIFWLGTLLIHVLGGFFKYIFSKVF